MGRVKDYILQSGGDRWGRIRFVALDTRGSGAAIWSIPLLVRAVALILFKAATRELALVHVNIAERGSTVRKGLIVLASRLVGVPVVLHLHAALLISDYAKASGPVRSLLRIPFRAATCCVVLGELWQAWLTVELGIDPKKIEILYNGVPVAVPTEVQPTGVSLPPTILFLGNLSERKGVSDLLYALAELAGRRRDWRAVFAGGGDLDHYRALAERLGVASKIEFVGWVDQARARVLTRAAAVLVLPSYDEGLPLVILEALGLGTPVICTPVGAIPEVLKSRETAILVDAGDRAGLARALEDVIGDRQLRQSLATEGRKLYQAKFTLEAFLDRLFSIYRRHCGVEIERLIPEVHDAELATPAKLPGRP